MDEAAQSLFAMLRNEIETETTLIFEFPTYQDLKTGN